MKATEITAEDLALKPLPDRTTTVLRLYFEQQGSNPIDYDFRASHTAPPAGEEPWTRKQLVGPEWEAPDFGWLEGCEGVVVFENLTGTTKPLQKPSAEELADLENQFIEVSFGGGVSACSIPPRGIMLFTPTQASSIRLRATNKPTKVRLVVLPGTPKKDG